MKYNVTFSKDEVKTLLASVLNSTEDIRLTFVVKANILVQSDGTAWM